MTQFATESAGRKQDHGKTIHRSLHAVRGEQVENPIRDEASGAYHVARPDDNANDGQRNRLQNSQNVPAVPNIHLENFARLESELNRGEDGVSALAPWLGALRRTAITRFEDVGFPHAKEEAWRHTNFAPIVKTPFALAPSVFEDRQAAAVAATVKKFSFGAEAVSELVFVNGRFIPQLSKLGHLPQKAVVLGLAEALPEHDRAIEAQLGRHALIEKNPFVALNTGFVRDGAYVRVGSHVEVELPIHLLFLSLAGSEPTVSHPRVLVVVEEGASATIVETYVGVPAADASAAVYFTNAVTEIVAGPNSSIDHCKLQQESLSAFHVATMQVDLGASATFVSHSASLGSKLTRNDLNVSLNGQRAEATLNGLVMIKDTQHVDNHTLLDHQKAHCPSHELYKHVLDGKATAVFKGQIFVEEGAQKTDSKQSSKSLLLSDEAYMNSQPALEIYADDVKCTHGSTTGPVDEEAVFYLRSRGISLEAARHLLTYAFAADVTRRIKVAPVRRRLEDFIAAQHSLPQDLRITELGAHDEKAR